MNFWLKFVISIAIVSLIFLGGVATYRYLNNKLTSADSWFAIIGYAVLLFLALAGIYCAGFILMGLMYVYIAD